MVFGVVFVMFEFVFGMNKKNGKSSFISINMLIDFINSAIFFLSQKLCAIIWHIRMTSLSWIRWSVFVIDRMIVNSSIFVRTKFSSSPQPAYCVEMCILEQKKAQFWTLTLLLMCYIWFASQNWSGVICYLIFWAVLNDSTWNWCLILSILIAFCAWASNWNENKFQFELDFVRLILIYWPMIFHLMKQWSSYTWRIGTLIRKITFHMEKTKIKEYFTPTC